MKHLLALSLLLVSCGSLPDPRVTNEIKNRVQEIKTWAPVCEGIACKAQMGGDGDSVLWAGLLCLSGETAQCEAVKRSQSKDGRFWRSPSRVGLDRENSFSRDMALGVLAYALKTKDAKGLDDYASYIKRTGALCPDATDDRCFPTPLLLWSWNRVAKYIGIPGDYPGDAMDATLLSMAIKEPLGFRMHLVATHILLRRYMHQDTIVLAAAADELSKRQPDNAYFYYLSRGLVKGMRRYVQLVPEQAPLYRTQWSFERVDTDRAWEQSMGWEWVFLGNIMTKGFEQL